jgi:hypothetical protein
MGGSARIFFGKRKKNEGTLEIGDWILGKTGINALKMSGLWRVFYHGGTEGRGGHGEEFFGGRWADWVGDGGFRG